MPVEQLISLIGHDGSEILWPHLSEPKKRKSFHPQEIIQVLYQKGYLVTYFEKIAELSPDGCERRPIHLSDEVISEITNAAYGVAIVQRSMFLRHAVAFCASKMYDPCGKVYDFKINEVAELYVIFHASGRCPHKGSEFFL